LGLLERFLVGSSGISAGSKGEDLARITHQFRRGFGSPCGVFRLEDTPLESPGSPGLGLLHMAWSSLHHDREAMAEPRQLDPAFRHLLSQRAAPAERRADLGMALLDVLSAEGTPLLAAGAVDAYLGNVTVVAARLGEQAAHDLDSLVRATGRTLSPAERGQFLDLQVKANRRTFLGAAMRHPGFLRAVGRLGAGARERVEQGILTLCPRTP
jgi:hypothetical protein